jgi:nucleotide-binding universal stress UspA family protein
VFPTRYHPEAVMSYRTLLVHVDDAPSSQDRLDFAVALARREAAELVGLYVVPGTDLAPSLAAMLGSDAVARRLDRFNERQHAAEQRFREAVGAAGLAAEWRAPAGPAIDTAVAHARTTDLVILGQRDREEPAFGNSLVSNVLLSAGRPVLVVPSTGVPATLASRVLIAGNGGREAARAVGDALPLLARAERICVVGVDEDREASVAERLSDTRLRQWLGRHDIAIEVEREPVRGVGVGEWLLSRAADLGSDLIVMGGYAHARMRELVLGGVTRTMLAAMTIPVLMAH